MSIVVVIKISRRTTWKTTGGFTVKIKRKRTLNLPVDFYESISLLHLVSFVSQLSQQIDHVFHGNGRHFAAPNVVCVRLQLAYLSPGLRRLGLQSQQAQHPGRRKCCSKVVIITVVFAQVRQFCREIELGQYCTLWFVSGLQGNDRCKQRLFNYIDDNALIDQL